MSTDANKLFREIFGPEDEKEIELVENIIEKTKTGKIAWEKTASSLVAAVPGGMQMSFVRSSSYVNALASLMQTSGGWEIFSIRTPNGAEILKVEQPARNLLLTAPLPAPPARSRLVVAVDKLYSIADSRGKADIDHAINAIKNL